MQNFLSERVNLKLVKPVKQIDNKILNTDIIKFKYYSVSILVLRKVNNSV